MKCMNVMQLKSYNNNNNNNKFKKKNKKQKTKQNIKRRMVTKNIEIKHKDQESQR